VAGKERDEKATFLFEIIFQESYMKQDIICEELVEGTWEASSVDGDGRVGKL